MRRPRSESRVRLPWLDRRCTSFGPSPSLLSAVLAKAEAEARSGWTLRGDRVQLSPKAGYGRVPQKGVLRLRELRVVVQELLRDVAGILQEVGVCGQPGDVELGQAVLARAEHLPRSAQFEVDLGQHEAVALGGDGREPRVLRAAEEDAEAGMVATADPATQLMQLRDAVALGL